MNFLLVYLCRFAVRAPSHIFSSFSRQCRLINFVTKFRSPSALPLSTSVLHYLPGLRLSPTLPSVRFDYLPVSLLHLSVCRWYWNIYQLVIMYAFRPPLSPRLTLGGRTFPRKPQTFDGEVSRLPFATYAGILSCMSSTAPFDTASAFIHCSSTNTISSIPKLRCTVLAPVNLRRIITRPVSYYALFECVAASKPTSWLF